MVLGALVTQPQHLKSLALGQSQQSDLRMAASFTSLATLELSATDLSDNLDISVLQALPHLHTLSLYLGEYCSKELPKGLLKLRLEDALLDLQESTMVPLQNLKVICSHLSSIHSDGILAYTALQELYLDEGTIDSSYTSDGHRHLQKCVDIDFPYEYTAHLYSLQKHCTFTGDRRHLQTNVESNLHMHVTLYPHSLQQHCTFKAARMLVRWTS